MAYSYEIIKKLIGVTKNKNMLTVILVITGIACFGLSYKSINFFDKI